MRLRSDGWIWTFCLCAPHNQRGAAGPAVHAKMVWGPAWALGRAAPHSPPPQARAAPSWDFRVWKIAEPWKPGEMALNVYFTCFHSVCWFMCWQGSDCFKVIFVCPSVSQGFWGPCVAPGPCSCSHAGLGSLPLGRTGLTVSCTRLVDAHLIAKLVPLWWFVCRDLVLLVCCQCLKRKSDVLCIRNGGTKRRTIFLSPSCELIASNSCEKRK